MENGSQKWRFQRNKRLSRTSVISLRGIVEMLIGNLSTDDPRPIVPLGKGDPSQFPCFRPSKTAEEAVVDAFHSAKYNGYASTAGVPSARRWILKHKKMKVILRKDGCLAAISEKAVDFTDDNKWIEMDMNAMTNFHIALADEVLPSIEEKKTAKEIWDHLTKLYEAKSLHNKIFLKRKLYTLRMSESTSVTEHLNTLNTLFSQLTSLSCKIVEKERAELLLQSLPDSRKSVQEQGRQTSKSATSRSVDNNEREINITWPKQQSQTCLNKNSNPQGNTANTSDDGDTLCCEASTTVEGRKRYTDIWLIDSGATYHMTSRREWFHHYEPVSGGSVYSYNDHASEIIGVGTIKLKMYDGIIKVVRDVFRGALVVLKGEKIAANLYMLKGETLLEAEVSVASCILDSEMLL
ncbi:Detected protein of unknown function [Hibiscus syriacus]|uniref:Retrovirus-related Pol polyprotein from transposon TNT 1-94-like beta-barrel domain-containing protein n=1 Tax=Hibiscus syriacus TaxID=106335 RepID=A0A6A3A5E1_HIBSY|nr:Detected protein of unknown function [Hibiscus syriacus]